MCHNDVKVYQTDPARQQKGRLRKAMTSAGRKPSKNYGIQETIDEWTRVKNQNGL